MGLNDLFLRQFCADLYRYPVNAKIRKYTPPRCSYRSVIGLVSRQDIHVLTRENLLGNFIDRIELNCWEAP
jgi:hypothetical protein